MVTVSRPKSAAFGLSSLMPSLPSSAGTQTAEEFRNAVDHVNTGHLRSDALKDVINVGALGLGAGVAGRGTLGLLRMLLTDDKPKKTRSGPAYLPLPYPVEAEKVAGVLDSVGTFLGGGDASSKSGIPWYGPAMLLSGMAGLGAGWKGVDSVLDARRRREMDDDLVSARKGFHDALLGQYAEPVQPDEKKAGVEVSAALDAVFDKVAAVTEKRALDLPDLAGQAASGYGMYAGLTGLLAGAMMYDRANKRSRRSILEKALQRRQRRQFTQRPTEIYAVPEPIPATSGAAA